jgi:AcrR family transcriptional regulator
MKPAKKNLPRKRPTQARSQARVDRILEAAAEVVEEVGYDAATTNAIAKRAGTSIGSLYQFFPNKSALMHALALGYIAELKGLMEKAVSSGVEGLTWREVVSKIVDAFAEFHRTRAGFRAVWFGGHTSADLFAVAFQCGAEIAKSAEPLVEFMAPDLPPARRTLVSRVATEIVGAMLMVSSMDKRPQFEQRFMAEAKVACIAYLERALGLTSESHAPS